MYREIYALLHNTRLVRTAYTAINPVGWYDGMGRKENALNGLKMPLELI